MPHSTRTHGAGAMKGAFLILLFAACNVYFCVTVPLRLAFVPEFCLVCGQNAPLLPHHAVFVVLDALSTAFFLWRAVNILRRVRSEARVVPIFGEDDSRSNAAGISNAKQPQPLQYQWQWQWQSLLSAPFLFAFLSALPLEYVALMFSGSRTSIPTNYLLLNRTLMLLDIPRHLSDISSLLEQAGILKNIGLHRAWKLFFAMALAGHWCGCGFYLVAKSQAVRGNPYTWPEEMGIYQANVDGPGSVQMLVDSREAYAQSLYWAYITMITTGFGDIVPLSLAETVWCILSMYVGVVITTLAIANLQLLVTNMDAALTNFQRKMERIKMYMAYRQLPKQLVHRIVSFYDYQWDLLQGADEEKILEELPRSLQQRVANFMCRDLVASIPFLRKANNALLNALAESAEYNLNIYSPNDDILKPGERIKGSILIARGEVEILRPVGGVGGGETVVERKLQPFDRFAEESLFVAKVCDRYVRAKTFCEVFLLPDDEFQHIIRSQCDDAHIAHMRETALASAKSSAKANKLFGSAEEAVVLRGFKKQCLPTSTFRKIWTILQLLGVVYYVWTLPLSTMHFFRPATASGTGIFGDSPVMLSFGYAVDAFFLVNLVLTSSFFVYLEQGLVVSDGERIRQEFYRTHRIGLEITVAMPLEILLLVPALASYCHFFRMTKLLRLPKIIRYTHGVERVLSDLKLGLNQSATRVFKLNFIMIVVCHWVACLWYACADFGIRAGSTDNWRDADEADETLAIDHDHLGGSGYLRAIYWAIVGMSTVGYGDIVATNLYETTFSALVILFGGLVLPAVVGGLAAYLGNLNVAVKIHRNKLARVRSYMRNANMDQALVQRVLRFYDYLWCRQGGVDEEAVMDELPGPIRQHVAMHVNGTIIDSVPFFALCDDTAKQLIVSILKPKTFLPSDVIAQQGEVGTELFLIERGQVLVSSRDGSIPYCTLGKGDYFGESCLLGATVRVATVTALTYCDCFVLSKDDYNEVMSTYQAPTRRDIDNAVADAVHRKTRRNNSISRNINEFPKCRRQTVSETLAEVTMTMPGLTTRFPPGAASTFRTVWDVVVLLIYAYNAWTIPFRLAFLTRPLYYAIDWFLDICLVIDSVLNYRDFGLVLEGELVTKRDHIKRHYLQTRFKTDVLSSLPLDLMAYLILVGRPKDDEMDPTALFLVMAAMRLPKLLRLGRMPQVLHTIFRSLEDTRLSLAPMRLVEFLLGVILVAHWAACGFFAFARWKNDWSSCALADTMPNSPIIVDWADAYTECLWSGTWIQRQIQTGKLPATNGGGDLWQLYIRSFNWALPTLVVVVIGDVVPITSAETLYVFLWIVIGVSINATIIGNVANIVANLETDSTEFVERLDAIKDFMHRNRLGPALQGRVEQFMTYLWTTRGNSGGGTSREDNDNFIRSLPYTLQLDLTKSRQRHIRHCPFFDFCSNEIIKALTLCLKLRIFSANDILIHADDMGQEMYFLERGTVEVVSRDGKTVFATLMSGCFFGETSLFFKQQRNSTVRAATFCEVYQLDKTDLDRELKQRDFDLSRMLDVFTAIAESNKRRNDAVTSNLKASRVGGSKLSKLVDPDEPLVAPARPVRSIFLPNSSFRATWDMISLFFAVYYAVSIPYRIAFVQEQEDLTDQDLRRSLGWLGIDFAIDAFFVADLYLRARCFATIEQGTLVADYAAIASAYLSNGMALDAISCLPLELLAISFRRNRRQLQILYLMRVGHFLRARRLPDYLARIDSYLTLWGIRISAATVLLFKMFFFYAMTNHWLACGWFVIHRYMERDVPHTWATTDCPGGGDGDGYDFGYGYDYGCLATWDDELGRHNVCNSESMATCYTRSFYFVITTISTVGYGDISPVTSLETIYENVVVLTGACFFAGIIGAFSAWLSQSDTAGSNAVKLKLRALADYMACRAFPPDLQQEIIAYHRHRWDRSAVLDDKKSLLSTLPLPLQMDLSYEVARHVIDSIPFLSSYPMIVQKRIAHALRVQVCPPKSAIYAVGDIGWDVYLIGKGVVSVTLPDDESVLDAAGRDNAARLRRKQEAIGKLYRPGNHFGESCITSESGVRQETAISVSAVELYLISKRELEKIWRYMSVDQRDSFTNDLLSRNGNTWHSFESDDDNEIDEGDADCRQDQDQDQDQDQAPLSAAACSSPSSPISRLLRRQASSKRFTRRGSSSSSESDSAAGAGVGVGVGALPRPSRRRRIAADGRGGKDRRLKSFSAASSLEALESRRSPSIHISGRESVDGDEREGDEEAQVFGIELSRLFSLQAGASPQNGRRYSIAEVDEESSSSSSGSAG